VSGSVANENIDNPDMLIHETQLAYFEMLENHFTEERRELLDLTDPHEIQNIVHKSISSSRLTIVSQHLKVKSFTYRIELLLDDVADQGFSEAM
jgi:hypothetical protein